MRVLVVGHERSATTWVGEVLGSTEGSGFVNEPDDARENAFAVRAMAGLGTLPVMTASDTAPQSLTQLWDVAFGARRPRYLRGQRRVSTRLLRSASKEELDWMQAPERRLTVRLRMAAALGVPRHLGSGVPREHHVAKSVHASLMIDWIRARWDPAVVVCFRHPLDVVASVLAAGNVGGSGKEMVRRLSDAARELGTDSYGVPLPTSGDRVPYLAWRVGLVMSALDDACRVNPTFHVVHHAETCEDPVRRLQDLVNRLGLTWTPDTEAFVRSSNRPGTTWQTSRVAHEQKDRWRSRLADSDARAASRVLRQFPIAARYEHELNP